MKKQARSNIYTSFFIVFCLTIFSGVDAKSCRPNGKLKGKTPPRGACNTENNSTCCESGQYYYTYKCSPKVTGQTKAVLTLNSFEKNGDGGGPSECENKYYSDDLPVVALSTGWFKFKHQKRCLKNITIYGNGRSVQAMVVDECDSTVGCDKIHDYQPPCDNNIVDASRAVWEALGVPKDQRGTMDIHWSDS